jgi:hypothetical protein
MAYGTINADLMTTSDGVSSSGLYGFKNRIINGSMVIDQRNAGASVTLGTADTYTLDRWQFGTSVASKYSCQQNAGSVTPPAGFGNYLGITSLSAYTVGSAETFNLIQRIEGFNTSDLAWGTANAKTVTLSAWVYSSLTGTFGGAITNSAFTYSYPFSYTISSANTWTQISITIAGPTAGTWVGATNGAGLVLRFSMGTGSTLSGTAGAWTASGLISATGAVSVVGTNGATFYITGVQLEKGSTATSFDYRPYGTELQLCQRYFWRKSGLSGGNSTFAAGQVYNSTDVRAVLLNPVTMRGNPAVTFTGSNFAYANSGALKTLATLNAADQSPEASLLYSGAGTTSATQGQAAFWVITNIDSYISVSAEL